MKVEHIMNRDVKTCGPHERLNKAAQIMWDTPCGAVPVVDDHGRPAGFLTDRDVCMAAYIQNRPLTELRVEAAMARNPVYCRTEDDLDSAAQLMRQHHAFRWSTRTESWSVCSRSMILPARRRGACVVA
jgi:CBS domain-containing protein